MMSGVDGALARPLTLAERKAVASDVRGWLRWQASLAGWRAPVSAVRAIPFVALYAGGTLRGCMGNNEGARGEKLARAFLSALTDTRFGGIRPEDRASLAAEVSFMRTPRAASADTVGALFEPGTHGIGLARGGGRPVFLLPSVARDGQLDASGMLEALQRKAGPAPGELFMFETETVVVRAKERAFGKLSAEGAAAAWLASLVGPDGAVTFAVDARTGAKLARGEMHHARAAAVIDGLADHGGHPRLVARARERLALDARTALRGSRVEGWPDHPARIAGTLALAARAGADLVDEARAYAEAHAVEVATAPWHAAQVLTSLGNAAPLALWQACIRDLDRQPWAPWTVLAAIARRDVEVARRGADGLIAAIRTEAPYPGAVTVTRAPEVAVTALTLEAIARSASTPAARRAVALGQSFLRRCQLIDARIPAAFAPAESMGAFAATPTSNLLRGDVTGHALRALRPVAKAAKARAR
jgi:AMMECR1 domain-containing protein